MPPTRPRRPTPARRTAGPRAPRTRPAAGPGAPLDEDKRQRILETAVELAERGGFEAVRLRDVARKAGVALGTLYKRFASKDEILVAALELEAGKLERRLAQHPPSGATASARVADFFDAATRGLLRRPHLARAVLRAITSGDAELTQRVFGFHARITRMIVAAMAGPDDAAAPAPSQAAAQPDLGLIAFVLQQIWFAALVGWMAGLVTREQVTDQVRLTLDLLLRSPAPPSPPKHLDPASTRG